jgi:NAD+ synthase (glutamine-hydrolysing)
VAFLAWQAWQDVEKGLWPFDFPEQLKRQYDLRRSANGWTSSSTLLPDQPVQAVALPNSPEGLEGGSLSPRGDWRRLRRRCGPWRDELKTPSTTDVETASFWAHFAAAQHNILKLSVEFRYVPA